MTILNRANDGLFNVLIVLFRAISEFGPMPKDNLIKLCSSGPDSDSTQIQNTLRRWTQIGLFQEEGDNIEFSQDIKASKPKFNLSDINERIYLTRILRRLIFKEQNNQRFWDREKSLCADLTRGLAFLMAQDIYDVSLSSHKKVEKCESLQLDDENKRILQNSTRWDGIRAWGPYLGFIWVGETVMIDPTRALKEDLPLIFDGTETLLANDFMSRVAKVLPVLDGGNYRLEMESKLAEAHWRKPNREDLLSTSLSRAIWRLKQSGDLFYEARADAADGRSLQRSGGQDWDRFTHVRIVGDGK